MLPLSLLLSLVRTSFTNIFHNLLGVLGNLIEVARGNGNGVKERRHQSTPDVGLMAKNGNALETALTQSGPAAT
jgi:hypothetical protein